MDGKGFPRALMIEISTPAVLTTIPTPSIREQRLVCEAIRRDDSPSKEFPASGGVSSFGLRRSTGGWEAMDVQMFYPTSTTEPGWPVPTRRLRAFPSSISTRYNEYFREGPFKLVPVRGSATIRPGVTREQTNMRSSLSNEDALGDQWDVWESLSRWSGKLHKQLGQAQGEDRQGVAS